MAPPIVLVTATSAPAPSGADQVRLNEAYTRALEAAGLVPLVVPPIAPDAAVRALAAASALVLSGGEDVAPELYGAVRHPTVTAVHDARDACEIALVRAARDARLPTLAICRGIQVVNVALGGTLVQDIPSESPHAVPHALDAMRSCRVHEVRVDGDSRLGRIVRASSITVNSQHHQAVARVAPGMRVTGTADDGVVEAAEWAADDWWMVGVQWHPEELTGTPEPWDAELFAAFAAAARGDGARAPAR